MEHEIEIRVASRSTRLIASSLGAYCFNPLIEAGLRIIYDTYGRGHYCTFKYMHTVVS